MSTLSLRLPDSLHRHVKDFAKSEGVSVNQYISTAVAQKMSALETLDYLEQRAKNGSIKKYMKILAKVPDVEPESYDKI